MTIRTDPEGNETATLFDLVDLDGAEVLEIGCGDGRLTWRYADRHPRTRIVSIASASSGVAGRMCMVEG